MTTQRRHLDEDLRRTSYCRDWVDLLHTALTHHTSATWGREKMMNLRMASTATAVPTSVDTIRRARGALLPSASLP